MWSVGCSALLGLGNYVDIYIESPAVCTPPVNLMEKTTPPNLALQTDVPDEELRQLQWRGRQITRVLMALRVTSRILAFTISFGPLCPYFADD
jgi:hypothetical protein